MLEDAPLLDEVCLVGRGAGCALILAFLTFFCRVGELLELGGDLGLFPALVLPTAGEVLTIGRRTGLRSTGGR